MASGYELLLTVELRNHTSQAKDAKYSLQGPVGLPLEDAENSSKFRDLRMGFLNDDGSPERSQLSAAKVFDLDADQKIEHWNRPVNYVGVDVKYFAALVRPLGDQRVPHGEFNGGAAARPGARKETQRHQRRAELRGETRPRRGRRGRRVATVPALRRAEAAGVARRRGAEHIVDFGYVKPIAQFMLLILNTFHRMGFSYGVAIILLTVRSGCACSRFRGIRPTTCSG